MKLLAAFVLNASILLAMQAGLLLWFLVSGIRPALLGHLAAYFSSPRKWSQP